MPHFDRINFSLQCLHFRYKIPTVSLARTQDFEILQSKQQTWRTYGAGECKVFDNSFSALRLLRHSGRAHVHPWYGQTSTFVKFSGAHFLVGTIVGV